MAFGLGWCGVGLIGVIEDSQRWSPYLMLALGVALVIRGLVLRARSSRR